MKTENHSISNQVRSDILDAALRHVPFEGWTNKALIMAVRDIELPEGAEALYFPGGSLELISFWSRRCDAFVKAEITRRGLANLRIRDKVTEGVALRLQATQDHEEAARRVVARLALPDAIGLAPKLLWESADTIWRAIGDTSTDGNFYSKRLILSGVIASSQMSWLSDVSPNKEKAKQHLDARIADVMKFETFKWNAKKRMEDMPSLAETLGRLRYGQRRRRRYR